MFPGYLGQSLLKKAIDAGLIEVCLHDIRQWTQDKHLNVDNRPFGGGPGMVMMVQPVVESVEAVQAMTADPGAGNARASRAAVGPGRRWNGWHSSGGSCCFAEDMKVLTNV